MKRIISLLAILALLCAMLAGCGGSSSQPADEPSSPTETASFVPDKAVDIVIGSSPGGGMDRYARAFADIAYAKGFVSEPMTINYQEGATGNIAFNYILNQKDDPYEYSVVAEPPYPTK